MKYLVPKNIDVLIKRYDGIFRASDFLNRTLPNCIYSRCIPEKQNNRTESKAQISNREKCNKKQFIIGHNVSHVKASTLNIIHNGEMQINMIIDLHGHTLNDAFDKLLNDVINAHNKGMRFLCVITGKGDDNRDGGSIKSNIITWINNSVLNSILLYVSYAHKKHGSNGALYFYLKKNNLSN